MKYPNIIYCANLSVPDGVYTKYFYSENAAIFWICRQMQTRSQDKLSTIMTSLIENKEFKISEDNITKYEGWVECFVIEE